MNPLADTVFQDAKMLYNAARAAFEQFRDRSIADRKHVIEIIRRISIEQCEELGTMEMEGKIGRLEHKIEKLRTLENKLLESRCWSKMLQR